MRKHALADGASPRASRRRVIISSVAIAFVIAAAMAAVTYLVYLQGADGIAVHLFYLPIILAAFYFGDYGAIIASLSAAALCGPWITAHPYTDESGALIRDTQPLSDIIVRPLLFFVVGMTSSWTSTQLRRRITQARMMYEVAQTITSTLRVQRVLQLIADHAVMVMDARGCSIRLLNQDTGELDLVAMTGLSQDYWHKGPVSLEGSEMDRLVLSGEYIQIYDVCSDPRFQYPDAARAAGLTSVLCVPLETEQRTHGVVRIYARRHRRFKKAEIDLLMAFANQAAVAIENAELYEDLRDSYYDTVRALTRAIEAKDTATYSHSERVADLADALAVELGVDEERRELLRFGATLHDVGKIGVSETSMDARSDDDAEHIFYAMHPLIGRTILAPVEFLRPALSAVVHHHERWDGTGFPERLAGRDIPLEGRIVAICDTFDRLMYPESDPYARRSTAKEALDEVVERAGTWFDRDLVVAFRRTRMRATESADLQAAKAQTGGEAAGISGGE